MWIDTLKVKIFPVKLFRFSDYIDQSPLKKRGLIEFKTNYCNPSLTTARRTSSERLCLPGSI